MNLPDSMIHQSFRYVLGRASYAVSTWCEWCIANWEEIPESEKRIIKAGLEDTFRLDDYARKEVKEYRALGMDCDRQQWEKVRMLWAETDR